jgi:hypothetical protein
MEGLCTVNYAGGYTFELEIADTDPDSFALTIRNPGGGIVDSAAGTLTGGNFALITY